MPVLTSKSSGLVNGKRARFTRLDGCGRAVFGDDTVAVTKGFVSVGYSANTSDGDDIDQKNADGEQCVFVKGKTSLQGYALEIEFCQVDPSVLAMLTGQSVRLNALGTQIVGFTIDTKVDMTDVGVAVEVWAGATDSDACLDPNAQGSFGYFLVPFVQGGILGDFSVENGNIDFTWTGANSADGNGWGVGPYNVVPDETGVAGPLNEALSRTAHLAFEYTTIAPPAPYIGLRPLLDPDTDAITAIVGTVAASPSLSVAFAPTPNDVVAPVYYDFGDGTWDYLAPSSMGSTTHVYAAAGTYAVKASSNGETWATTSVTVPHA